jgi:hypothetical protein
VAGVLLPARATPHRQALLVSPDPFGGACIHFEVTARVIPDRRYRSDDDLRAAVRDGNVMTLTGTARGASRG